MRDESDDDLIEAFRRGEAAAFERLYRRHASGLYTYLRMQAREEAEDLLQETFSRVSRALPRYRPDGRFPAWLYAIARNLVRDDRRRPRREVPLDDEPALAAEGSLQDSHANREAVREALRTLPAEQREVVLLRAYGDLSFVEIARLLGCPPATAVTRMHRAVERLRRALVVKEVDPVEL